MQSQEILQRLGAIEADLAAAIDSLVQMGLSDAVWPEALHNAAAKLESVQFNRGLIAERGLVEQLLRHLAEQTKIARNLLDTAATLHFGRVLSGRSVECGYLADGGADSLHCGGIRIEG